MKLRDTTEPFFSYGRVEKMYSAETQKTFRECFRAWIVPFFGDHDVESITRLDILSFKQAMVDASLSIARQYSLLMALKLHLKFCRTILEIGCLDPAEIRLPRRPRRPVEFLTLEEIERLLAVIRTDTPTGLRTRTLIEVLLSTGMRIS